MALQTPSTLFLATDGVRSKIADHFGADARVIVDMPSRAEEMILDGTPIINLFFYRILPSGFHAASGSKDPLMLRLHCLITPFSKDSSEQITKDDLNNTNPAGEINLQILGRVIAFFHENPVIGPLPPADQNPDGTIYTLETILRAPDMEEINHVWMTQGSDLPYRTSAAYEFSLIPIDPAAFPGSDSSVLQFGGEVRPTLRTRHKPFTKDKPGDLGYPKTFSKDFQNQELLIKFVENGKRKDPIDFVLELKEFADLPVGSIGIALAGLPGKTVRLTWDLDQETEQPAGKIKIKTDKIKDLTAEFYPKIPRNVSTFRGITLTAEYIDQDENPVTDVDPSNSITLNVKEPPNDPS
ncbi:MAG: Pvc16 family protein [Sphingomonadales bacterium]